jgi:hypothetical protein
VAWQAVLAYPMGVVRLMDMMAQREVVRNEALLLMIVLAHGNAEVQKIAAFEGAFERLFSIIRCVVLHLMAWVTPHPWILMKYLEFVRLTMLLDHTTCQHIPVVA